MEIIKIVGIGLISLVIILILRQYKPEYAIYVSIIAGILILFLVMEKLSGIINLLKSISDKTYINKQFLGILLKITGIAIITEFAVSICSDAAILSTVLVPLNTSSTKARTGAPSAAYASIIRLMDFISAI